MAARRPGTTKLSPGFATPAGSIAARAALFVGAPALLTALLLWIPWPALDSFLSDPAGTRITDRNGTSLALAPGAGGAFQERLGADEIPALCSTLFVQLEDGRYFGHPGVDAIALMRAVADRLLGRGSPSGASTITMQLARLVAPHGRTIMGKIGEALDALRIESRLTKGRILSLYLNSVPFGRNTLGVGAAAWTYFGRELATLSPAELLALAVIPRNPTRYDPFDHPEALIAAAVEIDARKALGIDRAGIASAVRGARSDRPGGDARHFARFVLAQLADGSLRAADGVVRTTLDLGFNAYLQGRVRAVLERYAAARITNAAVVAMDNETGAVLGWVGSRDFADAGHSGQIDGVLIRRQSASTLKPFLYASAIESGWTAATLLPDVTMAFGAADEETYGPENFDKRSHGVVRLRTALASSLNVPAVYTLSRIGLAEFLGTLGSLGFHLPPDARSRFGLGTAVGNAEVSLLELTRAFSVFPGGGFLHSLALAEGQRSERNRIYSAYSSWMICSILSDPAARSTGFGTRTYFRTRYPAMFKSGTSTEFTNLWCVGATPRYTVGAWAGNFDGRAVINKTGSIVPTQVVADALNWLMDRQLRPGTGPADALGEAMIDFSAPAGVVEARICTISGSVATPECPTTLKEFFRDVTEVPGPCAYHSDPGYRGSILQHVFLGGDEQVRILFPAGGQVFYLDATLKAGTQAIPVLIAARSRTPVSLLLDDMVLAEGTALSTVSVPLQLGSHSLVARSRDGMDRVAFEVR